MVLLRRWYVTLPALVISLGLAAMVFESVPAKYASKGTIVLLSPSTGSSVSGTGQTSPSNPLLSFDGSSTTVSNALTTVSTALIQVLLSPDIAKDLSQHGAVPATRDLAQSLAASMVVVIVTYATYDAFGFAMATGLSFVLAGACGVPLRLTRTVRPYAPRSGVTPPYAPPPGAPPPIARPASRLVAR
jgi:hypothetical protein